MYIYMYYIYLYINIGLVFEDHRLIVKYGHASIPMLVGEALCWCSVAKWTGRTGWPRGLYRPDMSTHHRRLLH